MKEMIETVLNDLGVEIDFPLNLDENGSCSIIIDDKLTVQIEAFESEMLIGTFLTEIPPGKFRENVFTQTLKANHLIPRRGTFAFNEISSQLTLFLFTPLPKLTASALHTILEGFVETAFLWKNAIESGQNSPVEFLRELEKSKTK